MHAIKKLTFLYFIFTSTHALAQHDFEVLGESAFAINHSVSKNYTLKFSMRSRYFLYREDQFLYKQQQLDIFHFSTYRLNKNHRLSLGIYYRNRDFFDTYSDELRFMQQYSYLKLKDGIRYGHRFRAEQRILDTETIFRERYRFAVNIPLKGGALDIGEPYFVGALEGLLSLNKLSAPEIDTRTTAQIGWQLSETLKLQTGLEHRLEAFNLETNNYVFVLTSVGLRI